MSRLPLTFACGSLTLAGSLDTAPGTTGLLIVSGGSEIRSGAFRGQSLLAAHIAEAGFPVFRFDRRGVGDSEGEDRGFRASERDIAAALEAFRAMAPQLERVVAFGNCDAASALILSGGEGFEGLVLANPWTIEEAEAPPPPAAIRARYAEKLRNPREVLRLLSGGVNLTKLARGLASASRKASTAPTGLAQEIAAGLDRFAGPCAILLAERDRTAQAFAASWSADDPRVAWCEGAGHSFAEPHERAWLAARILKALRR
ncbi:MAG: hydrolase 1, exosortase A system-associated [Erythrobacter sp.]|jgi:exosortase A-associated hydrolase 1|nr:hydrolase 1, exosortase A system-associated [Erythrobacter sp.]